MPQAHDELMENDISHEPNSNADSDEFLHRILHPQLMEKYEVHSYHHAASILTTVFPDEFKEIQDALLRFEITTKDIGMPGGNESIIPKKLSSFLRPAGWLESRIQADLIVRVHEYQSTDKNSKNRCTSREPRVMNNFIDGHKIDYVKGRVAFDLEWNSKDQTFDRDLYAMRTFHECGLISAGIMLTRGSSLNTVFDKISLLTKDGQPEASGQNVKKKYGASTTWMGKLLYRLNAGRHGGCPILAFGIKPEVISDWDAYE